MNDDFKKALNLIDESIKIIDRYKNLLSHYESENSRLKKHIKKLESKL